MCYDNILNNISNEYTNKSNETSKTPAIESRTGHCGHSPIAKLLHSTTQSCESVLISKFSIIKNTSL